MLHIEEEKKNFKLSNIDIGFALGWFPFNKKKTKSTEEIVRQKISQGWTHHTKLEGFAAWYLFSNVSFFYSCCCFLTHFLLWLHLCTFNIKIWYKMWYKSFAKYCKYVYVKVWWFMGTLSFVFMIYCCCSPSPCYAGCRCGWAGVAAAVSAGDFHLAISVVLFNSSAPFLRWR